MKKLSRMEMKNVMGGVFDGPGGGGGPIGGEPGCYFVSSSNNQTSCWYSGSGDATDLCNRVYGANCQSQSWHPVDCAANNCTMN